MGTTILTIGGSEADHRLLREAASTPEDPVSLLGPEGPSGAVDGAVYHQPDLVVLDLRHPGLDPVAFTRQFRQVAACADIPLLLVTTADGRSLCHLALEAGASDFVLAPPDPREYRLRIRNLLTLAAQRRIIRQQAHWLEYGNAGYAEEVRVREKETLLCLAKAGEYRDETTGAHVQRLAKLSRHTAEYLDLPADQIELIELAAPMHDIGKIGVPDALLRKRGPLTPEERQVMESHTLVGYEILKESRSLCLQLGAQIALSHHERFDGTGYPHGLRGQDIPIVARIVAVADVFDALTSAPGRIKGQCPLRRRSLICRSKKASTSTRTASRRFCRGRRKWAISNHRLATRKTPSSPPVGVVLTSAAHAHRPTAVHASAENCYKLV